MIVPDSSVPDIEYFLVCRSVSADVRTDEITLSGVIEDIDLDADNFALIPRAVAVGVWNFDSRDVQLDHQALLRVTPPGLGTAEFTINLTRQRHRIRAIFEVQDIPLGEPGVLVFEMLLNGKVAAHHRVMVHAPGSRLASVDPDTNLSLPKDT